MSTSPPERVVSLPLTAHRHLLLRAAQRFAEVFAEDLAHGKTADIFHPGDDFDTVVSGLWEVAPAEACRFAAETLGTTRCIQADRGDGPGEVLTLDRLLKALPSAMALASPEKSRAIKKVIRENAENYWGGFLN